MKICILSGGLGNQMFEYAFFLACKHRGIRIVLNRDLYEKNQMHNGYLLEDVFGVQNDEVTNSSKLSVLVTRIVRRYHPFKLVYTDKPLTYCEDAFQTRRLFYDACFIHPNYFEGIEEQIRQSFVFKKVDLNNVNLGNKMLCENSVSIHIRRGDFLDNPIYGVCDETYYINAIEYIKNRIEEPNFYIFSDDQEWSAKFMQKLGLRGKCITHNKGKDSYKDMYLMTCCRHNIIANSTFSWWGAWLNNYEDKIVIAPNKWTITLPMVKPQKGWNMLEI